MQTDKAKEGTSNANHLALGAAQNHWTTPLPPSEERSLRHCQMLMTEIICYPTRSLRKISQPFSEQAELTEVSPKTRKPMSCLTAPARKEPVVKPVSGTAVGTVCACSEDTGLFHTATILSALPCH